MKDFLSRIKKDCEARSNFSPNSTSSRNFDVNIGLPQVDGSNSVSNINSPASNNDVISRPTEAKVPSSKAGCSKTVKKSSNGTLKYSNKNAASNVTVSTIYDESSMSRNSLDLNNVFNSPYNDGRSSSSAVNPFRRKNLQVIMEEKRQFLNRSNLVTTAAQKAVVDRLG